MRVFLGFFLLLAHFSFLFSQDLSGLIHDPLKKSAPFFENISAQAFDGKKVGEAGFQSPKLQLSEASLLLAQASVCPDWQDVEELQAYGLKTWLQGQLELPPSLIEEKVRKWQMISEELTDQVAFQPALAYDLGRWQTVLTAKDQLRHRIAWVLDEMLRPSQSLESLELTPLEQARYYDLLLTHAFGNYQDLLEALAADPRLGILLTNHGIRTGNRQEMNEDIEQLFFHPYTGFQVAETFLKSIFQQVPSSQYVQRVAAAFAENENGDRGDLSTLILAIYLDEEADFLAHSEIQLDRALLLEPFLTYSYLCEVLNTLEVDELSAYLHEENKVLEEGEDAFLNSPDLLNFYLAESDPFDMLGSHTDQLSQADVLVGFIEEVANQHGYTTPMYEGIAENEEEISNDLNEIIDLAASPPQLLEYLDMLFVQGLLSDPTKASIEETLWGIADKEDRFATALYLIVLSPAYKNLPN